MEKPQLTELERLRLENISLKYNALEAQQQSLLAERAQLIRQIEDAHPGWVWRDPQGLVEAQPAIDP